MEQRLPMVAKKITRIIQVLYFLLRKSISKGKLLADLTTMLKRGKIAGQTAVNNILFHLHHHAVYHGARSRRGHISFFPAYSMQYEFSCSNSPCRPQTISDTDLMAVTAEMVIGSAAASPALPGFGASPAARQLRIADSPFPLRNGEEDRYVDEAAEVFIAKFYDEQRRWNYLAYF